MKHFAIQEILISFVLSLTVHPNVGSPQSDASIRIPAYDPKPPDKMLARRMGESQGVIQDPVRPPRHAEEPRVLRPLDPPRGRRRPRPPSSPSSSIEQEVEGVLYDEDQGPQLLILGPEDLRNPFGSGNDTRTDVPVGPPVFASTLRSAFGGQSQIEGPRPPALPPGFSPARPPARPPAFSPGIVPGRPIAPPAPPPNTIGPPTPPPIAQAPSPPPGTRVSEVTDIKCFEVGNRQTFDAILSLPEDYEAIPVFQDRPEIDPTTDSNCRMIPTQLVGMFQLIVSNYEKCGVRNCRQSNGEIWHCLILRFPRLNGLQLPEDEIVDIRCRPHDKVADADIQVLRVATAKYADRNGIFTNKPPTVFEGLQEFECEIGLFRQLPGTQEFNSRVRDEAPLELGEKVQLWSIVKGGDGWMYSRLSEVVIQKDGGSRERSRQNTVVLVFSDGCRNPNYKVIAEEHPFNDPSNPLVNKFTFRAFMFQDMAPGESLLISAKVIGCLSEENCKPAQCPDDGKLGYGKRRKRRETSDIKEFQFTTMIQAPTTDSPFTTEKSNHYMKSHTRRENITDWSRNLAIKIRMPNEPVRQKSVHFKDCKLYLFISLGISLFFCILAIGFVSFSLLRNRKKNLDAIISNVPPPAKDSTRIQKPVHISSSLSGSDTFCTTSDTCSTQSDLLKLPIPSSVKQRKKKVNAEIMSLFGNDSFIPYTSSYPPLLNYYGYMVVPRPQSSHSKKSLRALKRNARARLTPSLEGDSGDSQEYFEKRKTPKQTECVCKKHNVSHNDLPLSDVESDSPSTSHTSVIRITSSGSETISQGSSKVKQRPCPRPRVTRTDPIYSEIQENVPPTFV